MLPHEQTIPKDSQDRLSLLQRVRVNTSPIWGLSLAKGLSSACRQAQSLNSGASFRAHDDAGVLHELWPVTDEAHIGEITQLCASSKVLIADGHHRYQTARSYASEVRAKNGDQPGPHDFVLAFLVELSDAELSIRAFHRVVKGVPAPQVVENVARFFRVEEAPEDLVALPATSGADVVVLYTRDGYKLLYPLPALYEAASDDLDSSRLMGGCWTALPTTRSATSRVGTKPSPRCERGRGEAAFFLRPVPVEKIEAVAETGRLMPPKSTYFHPKPRTGMAFRSLE